MYDTTAADEPGWVVPPFEARRVDFADLGECIVGRGAEDSKGPGPQYSALIRPMARGRSDKCKIEFNSIGEANGKSYDHQG